MKITVYFSLGDVLECSDVRDSKRFWRMVSKHCKWCERSYLAMDNDGHMYKQRVVKVVKTI